MRLNPRTTHERRPTPGVGHPLNGGGHSRGDARPVVSNPALGTRPELSEQGRRHLLDLQKLESFRVVASTRNFTRAAIQLGYSQSSVTTHVKAIERQLGVRLFERSRFSRDVALTEDGRRTLEYAKRLLALADEAVTAVGHGQDSGAAR